MFKKLLSMILCTVMVMGMGITTFANESSKVDFNTQINSKVVTFYTGISENDIMASDVLLINYTDISSIIDIAKKIVDNGVMLYISDPQCSSEEISRLLSIPKTNTTSYQNALLAAYSIYKLDDQYIFANNYVLLATEGHTEIESKNDDAINSVLPERTAPIEQVDSNFSKVILQSDFNKMSPLTKITDNQNHLLNAAIRSKQDTEAHSRNISSTTNDNGTFSVTLPSTTATQTWNDILNVYGSNNSYYGYLNCTVYAYGLGRATVNGSTQNVYDVISVTKAYPSSNHYVKEYKTQIHCNFTDFSNLQTTSLPSGISYSQSVGLSGSVGSDGGSGGASYSTSWAYNPESQKITESSPSSRIVNWVAKTVSPTKGKAYDIAPGMRIASPTKYQRGAFSKIYCDAMILGITIKSNSIEVGGWF